MFKREFIINLKSLITWSLILIAMFLTVFLIYPSIVSNGNKEMLNQMLTAFPEELLKSFNMDIAGIDSVFGWFQTEGYLFLTLLGGVYSAILGSTILIKEENDKTIEFLATRPVSRNKIVTSKILCGVLNILILVLVVTTFNLIGMKLSDDLNLKPFLLLSLTPLLIFYIFFFISLIVSTFMKKTRKSMSFGLAFVLINYFAQMIGNMSDKVEFLKDISIFEFVSSRKIILDNHVSFTYLTIGIAIITICIVGIYMRYNKKEFV